MLGFNEERQNEVKELDTFVQTTQNRLNNIVSNLGWTLESISKENQNSLTCPFNNGHRVPEKSLVDHLEKCQWKAEGYTENDVPLSEPCPSVNSSSFIKFDEQLQDTVLLEARKKNPTMRIATGVAERLIPRTSDRLMASFTTDERKAIYDYVIANTMKTDIGDDIADINKVTQKDGDQPKTSLLELMAQERNLKRRRAKHRGVHTNKKSQVEILREVINQQMEMYEEYLGETTIKSEPKSPGRSETGSMDYQSSVDRRNSHQETKYENEWPRRSSGKYSDREFIHPQTFLHRNHRSPKNDFAFDRDEKRNRSESTERGKRKHHSKHKRDRSKERNKYEEGRERERGGHRSKDDKTLNKDEVYKSEDKNDRRKRHRSRDRSNKYHKKSKRRDKSNDKYDKNREDIRKTETDKGRKRINH